MRFRRVEETVHERMLREHTVHDAALDAGAPPVDEPNLPKTRLVRRAHVLIDHGRNVALPECMQVELAFDRNSVQREP